MFEMRNIEINLRILIIRFDRNVLIVGKIFVRCLIIKFQDRETKDPNESVIKKP